MTYAELFKRTEARRAEQGDKDPKGLRAAMNKFLELENLGSGDECDGRLLAEEHIQILRAHGERDGKLSKGSSSSWASRMKHVVRMHRDLAEAASGASFSTLLVGALDQARMSRKSLAKEVGMSNSTLNNWCWGPALPSKESLPVVAEVDRILKLDGRLVASLEGFILNVNHRDQFSPDECAALDRGEGPLHRLVRYSLMKQGKAVAPVLVEEGFRASLRSDFTGTSWARGRRPHALKAEDQLAFASLDRSLASGGRILAAFERELAAQMKTKKAPLQLPYGEWPQRLQDEWTQLVAYKTDNPDGLRRTKKGRWTVKVYPNGRKSCPSADLTKETFARHFRYALDSGIVKKKSDLRLAHAIVPEILIGATRARMERNGRQDLNGADSSVVASFYTLIYGGGDPHNPGCGFFANDEVGALFWSDPFFASRLPLEYEAEAVGGYRIRGAKIQIPKDDLSSRWQAYLAFAWKKVAQYAAGSEVRSDAKFAKSVADILKNPAFDIGAWLREGFGKLVTCVPPRASSPIRWARHVRSCVLFVLLATRGFRQDTLVRLTLDHVVYDPGSRRYMFSIPEDLFKQRGRGGSKGGVHAEVDDVLSSFMRSREPLLPPAIKGILDIYLKEARPLLEIESNSLFGWSSGKSVYPVVQKTTLIALARRIGIHAFRYLIATWAKREGLSVESVAEILCHLPATTQRIYDMTTAQDTGRRTNAAIKQLHGGSATS